MALVSDRDGTITVADVGGWVSRGRWVHLGYPPAHRPFCNRHRHVIRMDLGIEWGMQWSGPALWGLDFSLCGDGATAYLGRMIGQAPSANGASTRANWPYGGRIPQQMLCLSSVPQPRLIE